MKTNGPIKMTRYSQDDSEIVIITDTEKYYRFTGDDDSILRQEPVITTKLYAWEKQPHATVEVRPVVLAVYDADDQETAEQDHHGWAVMVRLCGWNNLGGWTPKNNRKKVSTFEDTKLF